MKTKIKLCGFKNIEDINYASSLDIDYLGMIFVKNLPRTINKDVARAATKICKNNNIKTVGVFLDQDATEISEILKSVDLDVIQLHGNENISDFYILNKPLITSLTNVCAPNPTAKLMTPAPAISGPTCTPRSASTMILVINRIAIVMILRNKCKIVSLSFAKRGWLF